MLVAFAILLDLSEFRLNLTDEASLVKLLFGEWPHTEFDQDGENDNCYTEVVDEVENHELDVDDGTDDDEVNKIEWTASQNRADNKGNKKPPVDIFFHTLFIHSVYYNTLCSR